MENRVYLVGAGPGEKGLITLMGKELLSQCDILIYDRLASKTLLSWTKQDCEKIYVGKCSGSHSMKQEEINALLVEKGKTGKLVVRLKGGDPFVFGRGGEEVLALEQAGIPYQVVPGVTSAIAVPEWAGIPVTHRGMSQSVHIITGHTQDGKNQLTDDYEQLAKVGGTLVFLMGMGNLEQIISNLTDCGKKPDTPAAIITDGTTKQQRCVRGTLETICKQAADAGLTPPGILVVGQVAACHMLWEEQPDNRQDSFACKKTGVVATRHFYHRLAKGWNRHNGELVLIGTQEIIPIYDEAVESALGNLPNFTWIVFTSGNGVHVFMKQLKALQIDLRRISKCRFAVIGTGTADTLAEYGFYADYMPDTFTASALAKGLLDHTSAADHILLARAKQGAPCLYEILKEAGRHVYDRAIYDVAMEKAPDEETLQEIDEIIFASASGVRNFFQGADSSQLMEKSYLCIGEITKRELMKYGVSHIRTAEEFSVAGILKLYET